MSEIKKKLSKEEKQAICKALDLPVNTDDDTVIYAYIECIDNDPRGDIDPFYAREMNSCTFGSEINRDIDTFIKHHKLKHKKLLSKQIEDDFQQNM